jgi:dihydrophenazinedicarboxylate synthase
MMDKVFNNPPEQVFLASPADPMALFKQWFDTAVTGAVREPGAMALATSDAKGRTTSRIVAVLQVRDEGLVFATHAGSVKGKQLAETGWASGVLYWREMGQQLIVAGPTHPLPEQESDELWAVRPAGMHAMSIVSEQSKLLKDENAMRAEAAKINRGAGVPPRPRSWLGYLVQPVAIEFWQADPGRLHQRLLYERTDTGWTKHRLQP